MQNLGGCHGLEVEHSHGDREDHGSNLCSARLTIEEKFSLHQAKMDQTLKSTWGVGKVPAMTSSHNLSDVEEPVPKWSGKREK